MKPLRIVLATALLAPALAAAQSSSTTTTTTTIVGVPASVEVSRLAPQLVVFAGGQTNFDSLVNGLALGTPVSLTTSLPTGQVQIVTFTPQGSMTPTVIAQTLETARQSLISRGVAAPSGQQLAVTLTGGVLSTQAGGVQVAGLLPAANQPLATQPAATAAAGATGAATPVTTTTTIANPNGAPSPAALIQGQTTPGGPTPPSPAQIIQNQRGSNISDTPTAGNISNTPSATATTGTSSTTIAPGTATTGPEAAARAAGGERGAAAATAPAAGATAPAAAPAAPASR